MAISILLLLVGFLFLVKGADFLVDGASAIARKLKISELVIGLTIVAIGTSAPELVVGIIAAVNNQGDVVFGNIIGSNLFNTLCVLGLTGMIFPIVVKKSILIYDVPVMLLSSVLLFILCNDALFFNSNKNTLLLIESIILFIGFIGYLLFTFYNSRNEINEDTQIIVNEKSYIIASILILVGLSGLIGGGKLIVNNAVLIAKAIGMSERLIGLTVVSIGTSLPELVTCVVAAQKGKPDIAIGNVVGSNTMNILFILGISGIFHSLDYDIAFNKDIFIFLIANIILLFMIIIKRKNKQYLINRWNSGFLFISFICYLIYLFQNTK